MDNNFTKALKFTSKWEGWYSDDKDDPGGKTKFGISDAGDGTVDGLVDLERDGTGDILVRDLKWEQAIEIYYKFYWLEAGCDKLMLPDAAARFDAAVNCGTRRALKWGEDFKTINANRQLFYVRLIDNNPTLKKYQRGWTNRVVDLRKFCEILAKESSPQVSYVTKLEGNNSDNSKE